MPILIKFDNVGLQGAAAANAGSFATGQAVRQQQNQDARVALDFWNSQQRVGEADRQYALDVARMENDQGYRNALLEQRNQVLDHQTAMQDDRQDFQAGQNQYKEAARREYLDLRSKAQQGLLDERGKQRLSQIEAVARAAQEREQYRQGQQNDRFWGDQENDWARLYEGERIGDERQADQIKNQNERASLQRAHAELLNSQRLSAAARQNAGKDPGRAARIKAVEDSRDQAWKMYSDTVRQMDQLRGSSGVLQQDQQAYQTLQQRAEALMGQITTANQRLQNEILSAGAQPGMSTDEWDRLYGEDAFGSGGGAAARPAARGGAGVGTDLARLTAEVAQQVPPNDPNRKEKIRMLVKQRLMQDGIDPATLGIR